MHLTSTDMKYIHVANGLSLCSQTIAQEAEMRSGMDSLNRNIQQTQNAERLYGMDRLVGLIQYKEEFHYDSVLRQTIQLALELDSPEFDTKKSILL